MTETKPLPMRLALRHEGLKWVAYCAKPDTMEGAIEVGSIAFNLVATNERIKAAFMECMKLAIGNLLKELMGQSADWQEPKAAPEHEKAGHG